MALRLDAALVHMNRADATGNGQYLGPDPYFDDLFCLAAERAYVSCEQIVPSLLRRPRRSPCCSTGPWCTPVAETPNGAHFTSCVPDYGRDEAFQAHYARAAADPDGMASGSRAGTWKGTKRPTRKPSQSADDRTNRPGRRSAWWPAPRRGAATGPSWPARWG